MPVSSPMSKCGAKTRAGGKCQQSSMPNGRCRMHGGKTPPTPVKHGRTAKYARVFGSSYLAFLSDVDLLKSGPELALFDQRLTELAEGLEAGISAEWLKELRTATETLRQALFVQPDAAEARKWFKTVEGLVVAGGDKHAAWGELLQEAKVRSDLASKAQAAAAKSDIAMTERQMVVIFGRMLDIVDQEAPEKRARIADRLEREVLNQPGPASVAAGAGSAGAVAVH